MLTILPTSNNTKILTEFILTKVGLDKKNTVRQPNLLGRHGKV